MFPTQSLFSSQSRVWESEVKDRGKWSRELMGLGFRVSGIWGLRKRMWLKNVCEVTTSVLYSSQIRTHNWQSPLAPQTMVIWAVTVGSPKLPKPYK